MGSKAVNWFAVDWRLPNAVLAFRYKVSPGVVAQRRSYVRRTVQGRFTAAEKVALQVSRKGLARLRKLFAVGDLAGQSKLPRDLALAELDHGRERSFGQIYDALVANYGSISQRTVYRALSDLYKAREVVYTKRGVRMYRRRVP